MTNAGRPLHAVLVRSPQTFSATAVASVLARRAGAPVLDFVAAARRSWGLAAESMPAVEAEELATALTAAGQAAVAAPTSLLESPVAAETVAKAEFSGDGFDLVAGPEHLAPERLSWSRLAAVCAAGLSTTTRKTVSEGGDIAGKAARIGLALATGIPIPLGGGEKKRVIESRDRVLFIDLLFVEPARTLRVEGARFDYSLLGDKMAYSAEVNFSLLLAEFAARAPHALRGKGTRAILAKRPAAESLYESLDDFVREERWLLSLAMLKAALP